MTYQEICKEIEESGLSILSEKAKDKLKMWIRQSIETAYENGYKQAKIDWNISSTTRIKNGQMIHE